MKILPFNPKTVVASSSVDHSRLGEHVKSTNPAQLTQAEHGIVILGIADDTGIRNVGGRVGAKDGPNATRQKLYKFTTGKPLLPIYDLGDLLPGNSIEETHLDATKLIKQIIELGHFPIIIGGGHDLGFPHALGVLSATPKSKFVFCNIDAHLDVRPTTNGITSGSPWYLLREHSLFQQSKSKIAEFGIQPHCNANALIEYAERNSFDLYWLSEIRSKRGSASDQFNNLLKKYGSKKNSLLVSLDIDSVEWSAAPGCSAPQTLGFSAKEAIEMSFASGLHSGVKSFGVFELSPPLDPDGRTAALVAHCISACIHGFFQRNGRSRKRLKK